MDARTAILARIEDALGRSRTAPVGPVPRAYRHHADVPAGSAEALTLLTDRLVDYKARVHPTTGTELGRTLAAVLADAGTVVVPDGVPTAWVEAVTAAGARLLRDTTASPLPSAALDGAGAVLTGCRVAVAETGAIVLDGEPDQGRRALTLIPDRHVCVITAAQVLVTVPEAVAVLGEHPERPLTWIAGPSATSDIELQRVEGVHGPRTLDVVLVAG